MAVVVCGDHPEPVIARLEIRIIGHAIRAGVAPAGIMTFELIFETHLIRRHEAVRRVLDLHHTAPARREGKVLWASPLHILRHH